MSIFSAISNLINKITGEKPVECQPTKEEEVHLPEPLVQASVPPSFGPVFPERASDAVSGSTFANSIITFPANQTRENLIFKEFTSGNIPDFFKNFVELSITLNNYKIKYLVSPDYISIGNDQDFIRMPLSPLTYQKIANEYGCSLPTRKMVNQIWSAASVKLEPSPNGPPYDATMMGVAAAIKNNAKIEKLRSAHPLGKLVAGHKKDVVLTKELVTKKNKVAIYGWFYSNGKVIQNLNSQDHDASYSDYSHGGRLIYRKVFINDQECDLYDVMKDKTLSYLVSDEGPFDPENIYENKISSSM
jgi:hypothetical protein